MLGFVGSTRLISNVDDGLRIYISSHFGILVRFLVPSSQFTWEAFQRNYKKGRGEGRRGTF